MEFFALPRRFGANRMARDDGHESQAGNDADEGRLTRVVAASGGLAEGADRGEPKATAISSFTKDASASILKFVYPEACIEIVLYSF